MTQDWLLETALAFVSNFGCSCSLKRCVLLLFVLLVCGAHQGHAKRPGEEGFFEIHSITFEGNDYISTSELLTQMVTRETPAFFNKFLYSVSDRIGRKNEFFDFTTFADDVQRLRRYYADHGFRDMQVDTTLQFSAGDNRVDILCTIRENYQSVIDTMIFRGIVNVPDFVFEEMKSSPKISQHDAFNRALIDEEVLSVRKIF